jgi:probable rRNA maturation factor
VTRVHFTWDRRPRQAAADRLRTLAQLAIRRLHDRRTELHVLVTGDATIRNLNHRFRDVDAPTDVLSFPDGDTLPDGRLLLGEIAISLDRAREQAGEFGHDEVRELEELLLHGILHLSGFDHDTDDGAMDALELELRQEYLS